MKKKEELIVLAQRMGLPNLVSALQSEDLQKQIDDIKNLGWIRCATGLPEVGEQVLVTNGKDVWLGEVGHYGQRSKRWSVVYDGAPLVQDHEIVAWIYKPDLTELNIARGN